MLRHAPRPLGFSTICVQELQRWEVFPEWAQKDPGCKLRKQELRGRLCRILSKTSSDARARSFNEVQELLAGQEQEARAIRSAVFVEEDRLRVLAQRATEQDHMWQPLKPEHCEFCVLELLRSPGSSSAKADRFLAWRENRAASVERQLYSTAVGEVRDSGNALNSRDAGNGILLRLQYPKQSMPLGPQSPLFEPRSPLEYLCVHHRLLGVIAVIIR